MERLRAITAGPLRLVVVAVAVFVATTVLSSAPTTSANAATFSYDARGVARIDACAGGVSWPSAAPLTGTQEGSASPSAQGRAASTTPSAPVVATEAAETTRVGRWMGQSEFDTMSSTGRVVEGGGGRTYVVEPPNPGAYKASGPGSVYAEFDVPSSSLRPAGDPAYRVIPGPNVTTGLYGPAPAEMPSATCIGWVCSK